MNWKILVLFFCSAARLWAGEINIAAAADLRFALDDLAGKFQQAHPDITVKPTYGASGTLLAQIQNGGPFDLFLSADTAYPKKLIETQLAEAADFFPYATGHIVLWARKDSPLDLEKSGLQVLLDPAVRKIAIANPDHAPYGRAARAALEKAGLYDTIKEKLVLGENVSQTAQFIDTGAADLGIIGLALAISPKMSDHGKYFTVPEELYPKLEQGGIVLKASKNATEARQFRDYLLSTEGKAILKNYGFD